MTEHEETAKRLIEKIYKDAGYHPQVDNFINAVAAALAQAEAKGVRMGLKRARMIVAGRVFADGEKSCNCDVEMRDRLDAEIAKAEGKSPA